MVWLRYGCGTVERTERGGERRGLSVNKSIRKWLPSTYKHHHPIVFDELSHSIIFVLLASIVFLVVLAESSPYEWLFMNRLQYATDWQVRLRL